MLLDIDPSAEKTKITSFIKSVLRKQDFEKVVVGMSGGIDSAASFYLLKEAIPPQNIFAAHLYYYDSQFKDIEPILKEAKIPKDNIYELSINSLVEAFQQTLFPFMSFPRKRESRSSIKSRMTKEEANRVRFGNIMARVRMIILYDIAKKHNALVCGTENKSEALLGYFTRFGDEASDFEPIQHLYKTQIYQLAKYLNVPQNIINKIPTAGLWPGQTDENEFGFSYKEADKVLYLYSEKKMSIIQIAKDFPNAKKIIDWVNKNSFKHHLPYTIK